LFNYPFKEFKFSPGKKERDYLLESELKALQDLFDSNKLSKRHQDVLANFLFTCYTGIAGDDMKNKHRFNVSEDSITFERGKTNKPTKVPLTKLAKRMLPEIQNRKLKLKISEVSIDLAKIFELAKINKTITYHGGRHTFAIISLMKGISLSVISKVLGHTSTKTTEIYAKVVDELLNQEMKKWDV
jgi:integrase